MSYWTFIVTQRKTDEGIYEAEKILEQRLGDKFWGLGERTPNRRHLKAGDRIVFYVGTPKRIFAATATLATGSFTLSKKEKEQFSHGKPFYRTDYGVKLENIEVWEHPRSVMDLVPILNFIENKAYWGAYFQGGVRQLAEDDFKIIVDGPISLSPLSSIIDPLVMQSQFALEAHLEEFIDKNWNHIHFGTNLVKYQADDQSGRQFPAGTWSIDFLCEDKTTGDLVVVELKRGKTSDSTVGQILRYMGWVRENLAQVGQNTRGIIIAQEVDDGLKYAVKGLKDVSVLTHRVDFQLLPFGR
jgi:predicted RNA-binding protein